MLTLSVGRGCDYKSISEALKFAPPDEPLKLMLAPQIFSEKIFCEREMLWLEGSGIDKTTILWNDGAFDIHPDGRKRGTFRSETAFFDCKILCVRNLTIQNSVGFDSGQAVAAAVYAKTAWFSDVALLSTQDTLFLGPLPEKERMRDGFLGPRAHSPRIKTEQFFERCYIEGDIDFVFGGADAVFDNCTFHAIGKRPGYLSAPSGGGELGFVFDHCRVESDFPNSLMLARPWRDNAKAAFLDCDLTNAVFVRGFDPWASRDFDFCEYPSQPDGRRYSRLLTDEQARLLRKEKKEMSELIRNRIIDNF